MQNLFFIGGKGGVGKSTISSALAYYFSNLNLKTLLISTDPAHNIGDIFNAKFEGKKIKLKNNLYAIEINPKIEIKKYINSIASNARKLVSPSSYPMIDNYYKTIENNPITQESALFDRLINIVLEHEDWDKIVIDTAPTGHTLRLFTLPDTFKNWSKILIQKDIENKKMQNIIGGREENSLSQKLKNKYEIYAKFGDYIHNACKILFVLNPDYLSIEETKRAKEELDSYKIKIDSLIINKILPQDSNDAFFQKIIDLQKNYIQSIESTFHSHSIWKVNLKNADIKEEALEAIIYDIKKYL